MLKQNNVKQQKVIVKQDVVKDKKLELTTFEHKFGLERRFEHKFGLERRFEHKFGLERRFEHKFGLERRFEHIFSP